MSTVVKTKNNKKIVLLNPAEKGKRYARQMQQGKVRETGKELKPTDMAWRAGYLAAQRDNAKAWCANNGVESKAKPRNRKQKN